MTKKSFAEGAAQIPDPETSLLAVPGNWVFVPEECDTAYLLGFVQGTYDSMNAGDNEEEAEERARARVELARRGVQVP
jgi:hypothetical protein